MKNNCNTCKESTCTISKVFHYILVIGGLNWGLIGFAMLFNIESGLNVINMALGGLGSIEGIVYILVGLAALGGIFGCCCKRCKGGSCGHDDGPSASEQMPSSNVPGVQM